MPRPQTPAVAVDIIIRWEDKGIILIKRKNPPYGWALPGGFVDYGESMEAAAIREAKEETSLEITLERQFHTYSDPSRDLRGHTVSTVFTARGRGTPCAQDDAQAIGFFTRENLPSDLAFDHRQILEDFFLSRY